MGEWELCKTPLRISSIVGEVGPGNVVSSATRDCAGASSRGGGSDVLEAGRLPLEAPGMNLVVKPDEALKADDTLGLLDVRLHCKSKLGASDGAEKMGVPGPTLGTPHVVMIIAVVLLVLRYMMLDVVSVEVKPLNVL